MKISLLNRFYLLGCFVLLSLPGISQVKTVETDIFTVTYSEHLEQPLKLEYKVQCPGGTATREGISWKKDLNIKTSDAEDYKKNVWDRGHLAPAAAFSCDQETIKKTFTYLNCALQHEGLNRGPWKELERFERDLAYFFEVTVVIEVEFAEEPMRVPTGAAIPKGFFKTISIEGSSWRFYFPNGDMAGKPWSYFSVAK
jgi:endonuclease G